MRYLFLFIVLLPLYSQAQKGLVIEGLGIFKVGVSDTSVIQKVCKELGTSVKKYEDNSQAWLSEEPVVELAYSKTDHEANRMNGLYSPNVRHIKLNKYSILSRYSTKYVSLFFLKGRLYEVRIVEPQHQLIEDLQTKYGSGTTSVENETCDCEKDGEKQSFSCEQFSRMWVTKNAYIVSGIINKRNYNTCVGESQSVVFVNDRPLTKIAYKLIRDGNAKYSEMDKIQNSKALEDL